MRHLDGAIAAAGPGESEEAGGLPPPAEVLTCLLVLFHDVIGPVGVSGAVHTGSGCENCSVPFGTGCSGKRNGRDEYKTDKTRGMVIYFLLIDRYFLKITSLETKNTLLKANQD